MHSFLNRKAVLNGVKNTQNGAELICSYKENRKTVMKMSENLIFRLSRSSLRLILIDILFVFFMQTGFRQHRHPAWRCRLLRMRMLALQPTETWTKPDIEINISNLNSRMLCLSSRLHNTYFIKDNCYIVIYLGTVWQICHAFKNVK